MKRCPTCNNPYTDDNLSFCPSDGTPLIAEPPMGYDPQATIMASPPKVTGPTSGPFGTDQPGGSDWPSSQPSGPTDWPSAPPPARSDAWGSPGAYQPGSQPMGSGGFTTPPPPPFPGAANKQQGLALASMICGITSLVCCLNLVTGIPAIVLGIIAMNKEKADPANYGGKGMALAGVITGGLGVLLGIFWFILQLIPLLLR